MAVEPQDRQAQLQALIESFAVGPNVTALLKVWQQVPYAMEAAFIRGVETAIVQDEQGGATERAIRLRERLDALQLYEALTIYDEVSQAWSPDLSWKGIALLQNNPANLLRQIVRLPGEDKRTRLHEALSGRVCVARALAAVPDARRRSSRTTQRGKTSIRESAVFLHD